MLSYKDRFNQAVNSSSFRKLSDSESIALKNCLLSMYIEIANLCKENNLCLMLSGGSVLGAIRHKGFIPWDDDLDLNMPRSDYDKLLALCEKGALGEKFDYAYPSKDHDASSAFLKIYRKDTKIISLEENNSKYPTGLKIDIFPIEGAPVNLFKRKIKGWFANTLRLIANTVDESGPWNETKKKLYSQNRQFYLFMRCRQLMGKIFSIISHKRWLCWYDSLVKKSDIGELAVIPTGRKLYGGETLPSSVFFPVSKGIFEGVEVNLPADPDAYLRNLYGDYMQIPPENKRESHLFLEVKLPEVFYKGIG